MNLNIKKFISGFAVAFLTSFSIHLLLLRAAPQFLGIKYKFLFEFYGFLLLLVVGHFLLIRRIVKKAPKLFGFIFTGLSLLKMAICVLYLFPYIYPPTYESIPIALNFITVYFIFLTFEVIFIIKSINRELIV